ncbi:MAG: hypothetical protein QXT19_03005 [Candidatus Woesearchaeota archaeon]
MAYAIYCPESHFNNITSNKLWTNSTSATYGIYLAQRVDWHLVHSKNYFIRNNEIGGPCSGVECWGMFLGFNNHVINNTIVFTGNISGGPGQYGITFVSYNTIANNTILMYRGNSYGIMSLASGYDNAASNITNNLINISAEEYNYAILVRYNTTLINNIIDINASGTTNYGIWGRSGSYYNNTILLKGGTDENYGIISYYDGIGDCDIANNTIIMSATEDNYGITAGENCNITNNTLIMNVTEYNSVISVEDFARVENNTIIFSGTSDNYAILTNEYSIIRNNNITMTSGTDYNYGILSDFESILEYNNVWMNTTGYENVGIEVVCDVIKNNITLFGSRNNYGLYMDWETNITITENNIMLTVNETGNSALYVEDSNDSWILNNTIIVEGEGQDNTGIYAIYNVVNLSIQNNTIKVNSTSGKGILFIDSVSHNSVKNNNITALGNGSYAIVIAGDMGGERFNDSFEDGTLEPFVTYGTANWTISTVSARTGIYSARANTTISTGTNYLAVNITVPGDRYIISYAVNYTGLGNSYMYLEANGYTKRYIYPAVGWVVYNTTIDKKGNYTLAWVYSKYQTGADGDLFIDDIVLLPAPPSTSNSFENTTLQASEWIFTAQGNENTTFTNTHFVEPDGSIRIPNTILSNTELNVSKARLNISYNKAFLNSSNLTSLNTSAIITLNGIAFADPRPMVDYEDDGTYEPCPPSQCTKLSYSGGTFIFNTTHFTGYIADESPAPGLSNLSIIKTDSPDPVNISTNLTYQINVTVTGNGTAYNVTVNDTYPAEVIYLTSRPTPVSGTNNTWILGNLTQGTNFSINITVLVMNITNGSVINNTANVSFQNETSALFNYYAFAETIVLNPPVINYSNITITKANTPSPVEPGAQLTYTITVRSTGTGIAHNVTVNDTYPEPVIYDSSQPEPLAGTNNSWILGNLTAGTTIVMNITVNVSATAPDGTVLNNTVNATYQNETGALLSRNASSSATVQIVVPPTPPSGGGSGGGGAGGVLRRLNRTKEVVQPACTEYWVCEEWGKCFRNKQKRTCTDINACGTTTFMPALERSCEIVPKPEKPAKPVIPEMMKGKVTVSVNALIGLFKAWLVPLILATIAIALLVLVFLGIARSTKHGYESEPRAPYRKETPPAEPTDIEPPVMIEPRIEKPSIRTEPKVAKPATGIVVPPVSKKARLSSDKLLDDLRDIDARLRSLKKNLKLLDKGGMKK